MKGRHLHFMGVGGVGMCGLAEILLNEGFEISGCDLAVSERTERLKDLGIEVHDSHDPSHVDAVDALVVTAAVPADDAENRAAANLGLPIVRRAEMLAEIMRRRRGIAVSGTHGKTTTTSMIAQILTTAGEDPTVVVGGHPHFMESHSRIGQGPHLVCEADEYDRSFLELNPEITVITNLELEHLDCYPELEDLEAAFVTFANRTSALGLVVMCGDEIGLSKLRQQMRRRVLTYGISAETDLRIEIESAGPSGTDIVVFLHGAELGSVHLSQPGRFNALNAAAAIAVALELELDFATIASALAGFEGVSRRFDHRGEREGVTVVDDYAHHPTEIGALIEAARQAHPNRRLVAVFQPHLFSRTRDFAGEFAQALMAVEVAVVMPIYPAREQPIDGVSSRLVIDHANKLGHPAVVEGVELDDAVPQLDEILQPGDVMLTVGAGDIDRLAANWLEGGA